MEACENVVSRLLTHAMWRQWMLTFVSYCQRLKFSCCYSPYLPAASVRHVVTTTNAAPASWCWKVFWTRWNVWSHYSRNCELVILFSKFFHVPSSATIGHQASHCPAVLAVKELFWLLWKCSLSLSLSLWLSMLIWLEAWSDHLRRMPDLY